MHEHCVCHAATAAFTSRTRDRCVCCPNEDVHRHSPQPELVGAVAADLGDGDRILRPDGEKIGFEQVSRNEIQKSSRYEQFEKLPAEQRERQVQLSASITKFFCYASPVVTLVIYLIVAAVLMATFNFGAGTEVKYDQAIAITMHASLPLILFYALAMVSLIIGVDPEGFNIRNVAATNPAYFMDPTHNKFLYALVSGLDVFAIWLIILTGIGYAAVSKVTRTTAIAIVAGWYVVGKLVGAAFALLG